MQSLILSHCVYYPFFAIHQMNGGFYSHKAVRHFIYLVLTELSQAENKVHPLKVVANCTFGISRSTH